METIVEYFVEKFEDLAFHENAPQMLFMDNKTIFIKWHFLVSDLACTDNIIDPLWILKSRDLKIEVDDFGY